jgi:hypothetical protein
MRGVIENLGRAADHARSTSVGLAQGSAVNDHFQQNEANRLNAAAVRLRRKNRSVRLAGSRIIGRDRFGAPKISVVVRVGQLVRRNRLDFPAVAIPKPDATSSRSFGGSLLIE